MIRYILKLLTLSFLFVFPFIGSAEDAVPSPESVQELMNLTEVYQEYQETRQWLQDIYTKANERKFRYYPDAENKKEILDKLSSLIEDFISKEFPWEQFQSTYFKTIREVFTQEEVDVMLAFYGSEIGKRIIRKSDHLTQRVKADLMDSLRPKLTELSEKAQKIILDTSGESEILVEQAAGGDAAR